MPWYYVILYTLVGLLVNFISNKIMKWKGWSLEVILLWPLCVVMLVILGILGIIDVILSHLDEKYGEW